MNYWLLRAPDGQARARRIGAQYERITSPDEPGLFILGKRLNDLEILIDPRAVRDFTWTWNGELMVSPKVLRFFEANRVTGFETRPVNVSYPEDIELTPPELHELIVTGWGGFAAAAAGVVLLEWHEILQTRKYSIKDPTQLIDPLAGNVSDFFFVWPLPEFRFVSERLANLFRHERFSGFELAPAASIPIEVGSTFDAGPVRFYLPEQRAHELDERFGISRWLVDAL